MILDDDNHTLYHLVKCRLASVVVMISADSIEKVERDFPLSNYYAGVS